MCSWDGEEYGLVGSTEWVEEHIPWLKSANFAYLNMDESTSGTSLLLPLKLLREYTFN